MSGKPTVWTPQRDGWLIQQVQESVARRGAPDWQAIAHAINLTIHGPKFRYDALVKLGKTPSVRELQRSFKLGNAADTPVPDQEVSTTTTHEGIEARSHGARIKTVEDLLQHIEADMTRYDIASCEATKHEMGTKNPEGHPVVTELHRVFVRLKPKAGPSVTEIVGTIIDSAFAVRRALPVRAKIAKGVNLDLLELHVLPEPHIGKFAWNAETGHGNYDVGIAVDMVRQAAGALLDGGQHRRAAKRIIACLGDYLHYDNPTGQTTKGTPLDRDGRVQKMIDAGARLLFDLIDASAMTAPTEVLLAPGNHDEVLTWALQRILLSHYRADKRVTINAEYTSRKYVRWGKTLLGFTHGDKPPIRQLPSIMARERATDWGETTYREIHTGDKHALAAIQTIDGVVTRICPSLSAPDKWHSDNGYISAPRVMEAYYYSARGALVAMESSDPMVAAA